MEETNITGDAVLGGDQLTSAGAESAGGIAAPTSQEVQAMTLTELNQYLGKTFPTKDTALKALKDTFSYVGKKQEDAVAQAKAELQQNQNVDKLAQELAEMRKERFFDKNPDLAPYRSAYEKVGGNPEEFFSSDAFKPIIEKARGYDEIQTKRTVLESNSRLAQSKDALAKAAELKAKGASSEEIEAAIVSAVYSQ